MAQVKNITLEIESTTVAGKRKVTVGFKLAFKAADVGKSYKYRIGLRGDDTGEALTLPLGIYYLQLNGSETFSPKITAQLGDHSYSKMNNVPVQILNEDPGFDHINTPPTLIPRPDEIIAEVSLYAVGPSGLLGLVDKKLSPIDVILV